MLSRISARKRMIIAASVLAIVITLGWNQLRQLPLKLAQVTLPLRSSHGHNHGHGRGGHSHGPEADAHDTTSPVAGASQTQVSNRIDVPEKVRQNLGITFAPVERRAVTRTLRVPGRFEPLPSARREYRTPLAGQVELLVRQYDTVATGTPLYRLDSPEWRMVQRELAEAEASIRTTSAALVLAGITKEGGATALEMARRRLEADERHDENVREAARLAEQRVRELERLHKQFGGMVKELSDARAQLAAARTEVSRAEEERAELEQQYFRLASESEGAFGTTVSLETALAARRAELETARLKARLVRGTARAVLGLASDADLDAPAVVTESDGTETTVPLWQAIDQIEVRALAPGIVNTVDVPSGSYIDKTGLVLTTLNPQAVRFRGTALQSDLSRLYDGAPALIVPPQGELAAGERSAIPGVVTLGTEAHPEQRTVDLLINLSEERELPGWVRPGIAAHAEVVVAGSDEPELAIPLASVIQDDLARIFFRRDPEDPDKVIRMEADLGPDDGEWVTVYSGVKEGDEVVRDGVYELKLTGSGKAPEGGHFHADGTFHEGQD